MSSNYPFFDDQEITMQKAARALHIGSINLFAFLKLRGVIDSQNRPNAKYAQNFYIKHNRWAGGTYHRTFVTREGLAFIEQLLVSQEYPRKNAKKGKEHKSN